MDLKGSGRGLIFLEELRKTTNISARVTCVPGEVRSGYSPNTSLDCYHYVKSFSPLAQHCAHTGTPVECHDSSYLALTASEDVGN
jgi:hypothetical protein